VISQLAHSTQQSLSLSRVSNGTTNMFM